LKLLSLPGNMTKLEGNAWTWIDTAKLAGYWRLYPHEKQKYHPEQLLFESETHP